MTDSQIEEIKNRLNILDVVGNYVKLTKTGVNHRGLCPFHSEKGPSFFVNPSRQMFKCFGCGKSGDIFTFVQEIEGVEFGDALKILANKAGIVLKRENPELRTERQRLYEICELACSFFEKQLGNSNWGKEAKDYLLKRGITEASIKKWRLGYSPDTWQGLSDFLVGRGYAREEIVRAGLAVQSDKGNNPYDRFRGRIIFPIFDGHAQVIGFGARIFKDADKKETAKYINTPQTLLYDKSNVLYGIHNAKVAIRKNNQCVLTEGYTDAIMAHQAGFENTVAASGTALTGKHLNILKRYSDNLLLAFDMDLAGDNATRRGINSAETQGFNLKVINTYSEKDPADIIFEDPKIWESALQGARTIMDYYFDSAFIKFNKTDPQGKREIGKIILPAIKRLQNKIEQSHWAGKLAEMLGVKEDAILEEMKAVKIDSQTQNASMAPASGAVKPVSGQEKTPARRKLLEERVVALIFQNPENLNLIKEEHLPFFSAESRNFIESVKKELVAQPASQQGGPENADLKAVFATIAQRGEYKDFLDNLGWMADSEPEEASSQEFQICLLELKDVELRNELGKISSQIKAEQDPARKDDLMKDFDKKAKFLHTKIVK